MTDSDASTAERFDLAGIDVDLQHEEAYRREGHTARTLVRRPDLRIVLVVMSAGSRMDEHRVDETVSVHVLRGQVRLRMPEAPTELRTGQLLIIDNWLAHDVEAVTDSAFLLTIGWRGNRGSGAA